MAAIRQKSLARRRFAAITLLAGGFLMLLGLFAPGAQADVSGAAVSTSIVTDNKNLTCPEIDLDWVDFKIDETPSNDSWIINGVTITLSNVKVVDGKMELDWTATVPDGDDAGDEPDPYYFSAVIVKQASGNYPVYLYDPPASSGHVVSSGNSISHITFCDSGQPTTTVPEETTTVPEETTTIPEETTTIPEETTTIPEETTTIPEETTTIPEETTTTEDVSPTSGEQTTTTEAPDPTTEETVLGEVITQPETLPATGSNPWPLVTIGAALMLIGLGSLVISKDLVRR